MKKTLMLITSTLLAVTLYGCVSHTPSESSEAEVSAPAVTTEAETEPTTEKDPISPSGLLPVLTITSKANPDSTDFIALPVKRSIAESIASWTPGYEIPPAPYYEPCAVTLSDTDETILLNSINAQVKVRGNWTTTYDKKPLHIKFTETQNLLGMNDGAKAKNWMLLAEYKDASMLRNKTALEIADELLEADGLYASDAEFVEVIVNGEYWGLYLLAEQQQINPDRVAITEAAKYYTGTDIGYFLEYDGYYTDEEELQSFYADYADNAPLTPFNGDEQTDETICPLNEGGYDEKTDTGITIKSDIYSQEQHDFIESYINNVYRIMYSAAYEDKAFVFNEDYTSISETTQLTPQQAVEATVNVNSLADAYILNEIACDADIYWSSFFMSVDLGADGDKKLRFEAPWDFDSAFGNKDRCSDSQGFYAANIVPDVNDQYEAINPWLAVLMHEDWFREIIRSQWTEAYDSGVFDRAYTMIEEETDMYSAAFEKNIERWDCLFGNTAKSEWSIGVRRCKSHKEMSEYFVKWLRLRVEFLNGYWHA